MKEPDFLKHYTQNAQHLMWFLGAGTSRASGLPTANDLTWDLKRKYYCTQENQDVQSHDINNKAIRAKIQSYMDSRGFPALWSNSEYSFYFELMFGTDYAAQQKYLSDALATQKIALTVGHRALAALTHLGLARIIFTTNFDEVVETAYASIVEKDRIRGFSTFDLGDPIEAISTPFLKSFFEEALVRAICEGKPLDLIRKGGTFFAVARHSAANDELYTPLRQVLGFNGKLGYISGAVRNV